MQTIDETERQFRRLAERALRDFREDAATFVRNDEQADADCKEPA